jgi:membrane associated rhomboid family serine protease
MIIPIGHENTEVRRLPWVTIAIIVACSAVLFYTEVEQRDVEVAIWRAADDLEEYFWEHPYLELDPRAQELLFSELDGEAGLALRDDLILAGEEPFPWEQEKQQAELDELEARFLELFASHPYRSLGLNPAERRASTWLTHMFTHAGFMHLLGNMFLLFLAGSCIEDVWGRPLYSTFYLLAGLFAAGFYVAIYPDLDIALVGASGAVSGVLGAFLVRYWSTRIKFWYWVFFFFRGTFSAPAWLMLPLWFGNEWLSAWVMDQVMADSGGGGVAHWAHVGGFIFGVAGAFAMRQLKVEERFIHGAIESKVTFVSNEVVEQALDARAGGNPEMAFEMLSEELRRHPGNYDAATAFWDMATQLGRTHEAVPALVRVLRQDVQNGELDRALSHVQDLHRLAPATALDPLVMLRLGSALAKQGRPDGAALTLSKAIPSDGSSLPTAMAVRLARTGRDIDPATAARAAAIALASPELNPSERSGMEEIAAAHATHSAPRAPIAVASLEAPTAPASPDADAFALDPGAFDLSDDLSDALSEESPDSWELDPAQEKPDAAVESPFELSSTFDFEAADGALDLGGDAPGSGLELDPASSDALELSDTAFDAGDAAPETKLLSGDDFAQPSFDPPGVEPLELGEEDGPDLTQLMPPLTDPGPPADPAPDATRIFDPEISLDPAPAPGATQVLSEDERPEADSGEDADAESLLDPFKPDPKYKR